MTTQTEPQDRPEIRTMEDLLAAIRMGLEIATRSDIAESERRVIERISAQFNARFDAQNRWIADQFAAQGAQNGARFDAQDTRMDDRMDAQDAQTGARFDAQDRRMDDRFDDQNRWIADQFAAQNRRLDAQDRRQDAQDARQDAFKAQLDENTAAIIALNASSEAERRSKTRTIQWLSLAVGALGALAAVAGFAMAFLGG